MIDEKENDGQMLQRLGMDGHLWAEEMHKRFPAISVDDLIGWCCNMIMNGYDEAVRRTKKKVTEPTDADWKNKRIEEIKPCPYVNGFSSDNADVSFMTKDYEGYLDFILFRGAKPDRCFRFLYDVQPKPTDNKDRGCIYCNPIKRYELLGNPAETVSCPT